MATQSNNTELREHSKTNTLELTAVTTRPMFVDGDNKGELMATRVR